MMKNVLTCLFAFLAGIFVATFGYVYYEKKIELKRNEERYFELALQLKRQVIYVSSLKKNELEKLEKYQIEEAKTLMTMLDHYGEDSTTELYKEKIDEIVNEAKLTIK